MACQPRPALLRALGRAGRASPRPAAAAWPGIWAVAGPALRLISTKKRNRIKLKKYHYIKDIKAVRYVSAIPQYTGPVGKQTKKRAVIKNYRKMPRLRQFQRER